MSLQLFYSNWNSF